MKTGHDLWPSLRLIVKKKLIDIEEMIGQMARKGFAIKYFIA